MSVDNLTRVNLSQFTGTTTWYYHSMSRECLMTEGTQYLNENGAAWLVDVIVSHIVTRPSLKEVGFIRARLTVREDDSAVVVGQADEDLPPLFSQEIQYTDFPIPEFDIFCQWDGRAWVIYLPSEH